MKFVFLASILSIGLSAGAAEVCKKADLKDCVKVLKSKEGAADFIVSYDQVCRDNKEFKCLKRTVRGDVKEEMKYIKEEHPKANFFTVKDGDEEKIFLLERK